MSNLFETRCVSEPNLLADLFGEITTADSTRTSVATQMYAECRLGGGNHRQAYAMLVDEAGAELADHAAVWGRNIAWRETPASQDIRRYGESYKDAALREAGLIDLDD